MMAQVAAYEHHPEDKERPHWCAILPTDAVPHSRYETGSDEAWIRSRVAGYNNGSVLTPEAYEATLAKLKRAAAVA